PIRAGIPRQRAEIGRAAGDPSRFAALLMTLPVILSREDGEESPSDGAITARLDGILRRAAPAQNDNSLVISSSSAPRAVSLLGMTGLLLLLLATPAFA